VSPRNSKKTEFAIFGGKGGVGKTTCAASHAVRAARAGFRVLAVSTDPAHSLGDVFGVRLTSRPAQIAPRLSAVELDAPGAFRRWLGAHRRAFGDILEHGTWLDRDDVEAILDLPIPGIDELVGLLEIVRLAEPPRFPRRYDAIVIDTAPTGHTLHLLAAPDTVGAVAEAFDRLQGPHRQMRLHLGGAGTREAADRLIELLATQARRTGELLRDPSRTAFTLVTLPEPLSVAESEDAAAALQAAQVSIPTVLINRVLPDGPPCPNCDRRRAAERRMVERVTRTIGRGRVVRLVPARPREPRGIAALASLPSELRLRPSLRAARQTVLRPVPCETLFGSARVVFFGGKGGVGKTTVATAAALRLAQAEPARQVLLISTDPAHSIGDVLGLPVGDLPRPIRGGPPNLRVREIDAGRALAARRERLDAAAEQLTGALHTGDTTLAGSDSTRQLLNAAPPGIDELFGLLEIVQDAVEPSRRHVIVIDTAPTGHALRLLETPALARDWIQLLMRVLLKYKGLVRPGRLGAELLELSRAMGSLQTLLKDHDAARFIVVTRAAAVPRLETGRLVRQLRRLRLHVPAVVANGVTVNPLSCPWCNAAAHVERRELELVRELCRPRTARCAIIQTPLAVPPPRGIPALERWAHSWIA
jgi:arsenite-transporting ATPase